MKILVISGFLGAGKTTFIKALAKHTGRSFAIWHQAAVDLFVAHPNAPFYTRDIDYITGSEIVYVSDLSARLQTFDGL